MKKTTKSRVEKPYASGMWTKARFWSFVRSNLRRAQWPPIYHAKKLAERPYKGPNKLQKYEYQCAECKNWFKGTEIQIDHCIPCGSLNCYEDLHGFVERLYCETDKLRALCTSCHLSITNKSKLKHDEQS